MKPVSNELIVLLKTSERKVHLNLNCKRKKLTTISPSHSMTEEQWLDYNIWNVPDLAKELKIVGMESNYDLGRY